MIAQNKHTNQINLTCRGESSANRNAPQVSRLARGDTNNQEVENGKININRNKQKKREGK